jgi:hypothetical protein
MQLVEAPTRCRTGRHEARRRNAAVAQRSSTATGIDTFMGAQLALSLVPVERFVGQVVGELFGLYLCLILHFHFGHELLLSVG